MGAGSIPFLNELAHTYMLMPQMFEEDPVEAFKRNVYVNPFHEDDIASLIDVMGIDHILFGSDYPHPEGLAEPCSYADHLPEGLSDDRRRQDHGRQPRPAHGHHGSGLSPWSAAQGLDQRPAVLTT